jgi:hypothetical protein
MRASTWSLGEPFGSPWLNLGVYRETIMESATAAKIFLSYAHEDGDVADLVVKALEKIGLAPWIDRTEVKAGDSFVARMNQGLTRASYVILLVSRASLASRWVSREWMSALAGDETVLLPILLEDCELPPLLRDIVYIDLRSGIDLGLARLRSFFEKERSPVTVTPKPTRAEAPGLILRAVSRRSLRLVALRCMTERELDGFLFDVGMESGVLRGTSLHERITNLLVRVATDGDLEEFADWLALEPSCSRCVANEMRRVEREEPWRRSSGV